MRALILLFGLTLFALPAWAEGDVAKGEAVFNKFCKRCHVPIPGDPLAAPSLNGIVDRPIADADNYRYSKPFRDRKKQGFVWSDENLRQFIRNPRGFIPGSVMVFTGVKRSSHRNNLMAYLRTLK